MESKAYQLGNNGINEIRNFRQEILKANSKIESADFRLSFNPNDSMWLNIKKEATEEKIRASKKCELYKDEIKKLKKDCSEAEWIKLLSNLGVTLAETEDITHVKDSLYDENDLRKAVEETGNKIIEKKQELEEAKLNKDLDNEIILQAELFYYTKEMMMHHWGIDRLYGMNDEDRMRKM